MIYIFILFVPFDPHYMNYFGVCYKPMYPFIYCCVKQYFISLILTSVTTLYRNW